ncbi:tyrosine-type recombinase/integrase [Pseudodonghicola flavimaris]|uniref:tyrosine-type recombinase/integrase n=1 Tax=Pseudodonghicola flavimaris TaxID=3050036 RepID=UPI00389AC8D4
MSIGRLRGGLCVYWTGPGGKRVRRQLASRTRKEAEAEALEVYRAATYASRPKDPTIAEIWEAYREDLGDKPTATTMGYTGKAILPHFGHLRPEDLTKTMCRAYDASRRAAGISQGSIHTEIGHLQSALNFHLGKGAAPTLWRPAKPQTDKRILNAGEARALIDAAIEPHIRLALILLLGTAGRVGAILDLTWDRVDFERGSINLRLDDSATRKGRAVVPMNSSTRAALDVAHRAALSDHVIEYAGRQVGSIRKGVQSAVTRSGIGHVRIHDLRHTAAVTMLANGIPLEKVSQVLGHSNTSITFSTYGRYLPEHMQDAVNVLDFMNLKTRT